MPTPAPSKKDRRGKKRIRQRADAEPSLLGRMFLVAARQNDFMWTVFGAYTRREYAAAVAHHDAKRSLDHHQTPAARARWLAEQIEVPCWCGTQLVKVPRDVVLAGKTASHEFGYVCHPPHRKRK